MIWIQYIVHYVLFVFYYVLVVIDSDRFKRVMLDAAAMYNVKHQTDFIISNSNFYYYFFNFFTITTNLKFHTEILGESPRV